MWISNAYWVVFSFSQLQSNKLAQITYPKCYLAEILAEGEEVQNLREAH